ncbi:MAG TPA: DNA polymerase IV [Acidimicrobiales bacterium]|nr:DNA polymerase IV [Acidimicrobiales bacterium]
MTAALTIVHVDIDAFYAAVEVLCDPSLRGRPVIVGGAGNRGVVASCSYEARASGVRSAMPSARARRLCPDAVFLPGHFDLYAEYSQRFHAVLTSFTPLVEGIALDEAFLDVGSVRRLFGDAPAIAERIRDRVYAELGLSVSAGIATSKLVAKLASVAAKPTPSPTGPVPGPGVIVVTPEDELAFLHPLPVGALWGVGPATRGRLERFGVQTVGDLSRLPVETIVGALGKSLGSHLHALSWGRDPRPVVADRAIKSIGHEETYAKDHHDRESLRREVIRLSDAVATRLLRQDLAARTVILRMRFADFRTVTRSKTVAHLLSGGGAIAALGLRLLDDLDPSPGVRLLGISASNLEAMSTNQMVLGDGLGQGPGFGRAGPSGSLVGAVDEVRRRFGDKAVGPAALVGNDGVGVRRLGDRQWGPGS